MTIQRVRLVELPVLALALLVPVACGNGDDNGTDVDNRAPTASITANPTQVPAGDGNQTVVTLDGSASSDPDGDALTYAWTVPSGTFVGGTGPSDAVVQVTFPGTAPYTVTLTVNDGQGGSAQAQVTIGLVQGPANQPPTASATANPTTVPQGDGNQTVVTIDGSASSDPDGDALTYSWDVPSGTFVGGTSATDAVIQVTFPGVADYVVTLTVNDGNGGTATAQVTIALG